ncbi:voltage-dependent calcium channel subunit alpha-2/delta-3, partial [Aplysia californica]|uniref:Voltage-dependent calcium channel subunit alpha-2/delta-3 n=1 Tax=Aplysia californica TaxID=6500 RepID=A0ABM0ZXK0_APLCA
MAFRNVDMAFLCVTVLAVVHCCCGQRMDNEERDIRGILSGADDFRGYLVELAKIVTGTGMLKEKTSLKVVKRSQDNMDSTMLWVKVKMEELLEEKQRAVKKLKAAAEKAMKSYGPYKEFIDFKDVNYFNAKKVVIEKDISTMDNQSRQEITKTINYLPTKPTWSFKPPMMRPLLNSNVSSIHVPTNIYDKSMKILNGVQWTSNLTSQFVANTVEDNTLTWQYFCSSDGFF